jgi:hypothetical protein
LPWASSRPKSVSAVLFSIHFVAGLFITSPEDVAAVQNDRFMKVWEGTSENQWWNTPKSRAMRLSTGSCSGM